MSEAPRYWCVVPAAGVGRRMGGVIPKQYLLLNGKLVIEHVLERLLDHPLTASIYVAVANEDRWWDGCCFAGHPRVVRVEGGRERSHSVLNALCRIMVEADPNDWVLVHDAARPCLRTTDVDRLIDELAADPVGGILASRVVDTIKSEQRPGVVGKTLPREHLWRAFTPQMFRLGLLHEALNAALQSGSVVSDEASAIELHGLQPRLIEGHSDNIKITHPSDLDLAAYYLQQQHFGVVR